MASDRSVILARRKFFIGSALAGIGVGCDRKPEPEPAAPEPSKPSRYLLPPEPAPSATTSAPSVPTAHQPFVDLKPDPPPKIRQQTPPRVCLRVAPPSLPNAGNKTRTNCTPPYYTDKNGVKRVKKECL